MPPLPICHRHAQRNRQSLTPNHHAAHTTLPKEYKGYAPHLALFLFLFSIYLLTYTPRINSSDGLAMFSTAESLVRRGALDIEQIRWMDLQQGTFGLDGLLYSRKGVGVPIGLLPLTWLGLVVPWWGTVGASLLFNAIVTALTAVLIFTYLIELGYTARTGLMVALTFGLTTLAWPYAKSLFSDPFSGLLLLAATYTLLKFRRGMRVRGDKKLPHASPLLRSALIYPLLVGLFLAWNVATRYAEAVFVPVFGLLLLFYIFQKRGNPYSSFSSLFAFVLPILLTGLGLTAFNLSRYGDPLNTGYLPNETFSGILWQGLLGQLFSPGRGLFLYCPIFLLSLVGLPAFFRRHTPAAVIALAVILIHLLMYGKWFMWHGGYAWGPRFMIPTLPFWAILLAPVVEQACNATREHGGVKGLSLFRLLFLMLAALGFIAQLLSVAIDFAPFQNSLLDSGLPLFDPQTFFDPRYSPFLAAWKFVTPESLDLAWTWQGQINSWLLAVLLTNVVLTGLSLRMGESAGQPRNDTPSPLPPLALISTLAATALLLTHVHTLPPASLQQTVTALNAGVRSDDAVITNTPEMTMPFAELYKGRASVLGLQSGGPPLPGPLIQRINETISQHRQVWWLPDGRAPEQSAVEQMLMANSFRARNDTFEGQRLALFATPADLSAYIHQLEAVFGEQIKLLAAAYPPQIPAGTVLPIELHWQALTKPSEDYHVFIHMVDNTGETTAQADGQPVLWTRPTANWTAGEKIIDRYGVWLPPGTSPGEYQLLIGLYRPADGQRVPLTSGEDAVKLRVTIR